MTNDSVTKGVDRPLRRVCAGHIIAGVASGIAEYLDVDVSIVRLGFIALTLIGGSRNSPLRRRVAIRPRRGR